ncbi:hypothetical protein Xen7305DRAFT_00017600 [Xenococcus sp. PCC 7305]|nr:hypothetical protein Xen7305DRAFT_00017600 [Xenococcus sp. PCC 7305]
MFEPLENGVDLVDREHKFLCLAPDLNWHN